jgi:hypothetical protein
MLDESLRDYHFMINGKTIKLDGQIYKAIIQDAMYIFLLNMAAKKAESPSYRNVQAYNHKGKKLWDAEVPSEIKVYDDLRIEGSGNNAKIIASYYGVDFVLDIKTGKIKDILKK